MDNDGTNEIVMVSFESDSGYSDGIIFIYDAETYELEWQSGPILNGRAWTGVHALVLADVDNDNVLEILVATADLYDGLIMAYDGITHNLDWQTVGHDGTFFSALAVADIDNDGQLEVIGGQDREHTGAPGVYVRVFDGRTGVEEWRTTNLTYWGGVYDIDTGDFDQDGNPEILFSVTDGYAYVYDGVTHVQEWQSSFSNTRAVAGFDVDQDGDQEILVGTSSGRLYAFDLNNFVPPVTFPVHIGDPIPVRPIAYPGEVFYTTLVQIPEELPAGGHFYFSSQPDRVVAVLVDDELVIRSGGAQVFAYDFSTSGTPVPAAVEVPRGVMEQLAGQTVSIEYRDRYAEVIQASAIWLIWVPW